jgi:SAM-dependent methyltransferase
MSEENASPNVLQTYSEARSILDPLLSAAQLLGLLQGAHRSGLLAAARSPVSPAQLAAVTGIAESRVVDICRALDAHEVLIQTDGQYQLAGPWLVLTAPNSPFLFEDILAITFTQMKILTNAAGGDENYWTLTSEDRLATAKGVTINPASPQAPGALARNLREHISEIDALFAAGGHYLELGCGVGGGMLSFLQAYPKLTAVGVELAPDLLAVARQRALDLGVSDRVHFYEGDARDFQAPAQFDAVFWSQSFFPTASRAAALRVAYQSLKPGGLLLATLQMWEPSIITGSLHTKEGREYAITRIIHGGWGVPDAGAEALQQEIEAAGFIEAKAVTLPSRRRILARRPA